MLKRVLLLTISLLFLYGQPLHAQAAIWALSVDPSSPIHVADTVTFTVTASPATDLSQVTVQQVPGGTATFSKPTATSTTNGTATATATHYGTATFTLIGLPTGTSAPTVQVTVVPVLTATVADTSISPGTTTQAGVLLDGAVPTSMELQNAKVTYSGSNNGAATINATTGLITGVRRGQLTSRSVSRTPPWRPQPSRLPLWK